MKTGKMSIGMRNVKTALAVMLCIITSRLFTLLGDRFYMGAAEELYNFLFIRSSPLYSSIAALVCMGTTVHETVETGLGRIAATFIGGSLAVCHIRLTEVFTGELFYYLSVFAFIVILIFICNLFGKGNLCAIGGMIFLVVIFSAGEEPAYINALHRLIDTVTGVAIAFFVNRYVGKNSTKKEK